MNLLIKNFADYLEAHNLFPDFKYSFKSSRSTANFLSVVVYWIVKALNMAFVAKTEVFNIQSILPGFGPVILFPKLILVEFLLMFSDLFLHFSVTGCFVWFGMGSLHKNFLSIMWFLKNPRLHINIHLLTMIVLSSQLKLALEVESYL